MENLLAISLVLVILFLVSKVLRKPEKPKLKLISDKNERASELNLLFDRAKKEFLGYEVIKKEGKVVIRELTKLRGTPKELVFIRITNEGKSVRVSTDGKQLIARYPDVPSKEEMRNDFLNFLNKF